MVIFYKIFDQMIIKTLTKNLTNLKILNSSVSENIGLRIYGHHL